MSIVELRRIVLYYSVSFVSSCVACVAGVPVRFQAIRSGSGVGGGKSCGGGGGEETFFPLPSVPFPNVNAWGGGGPGGGEGRTGFSSELHDEMGIPRVC